MNHTHLMSVLLKSALWGVPLDYHGQRWPHPLYHNVMQFAIDQTVVGLASQALMSASVKMEEPEDVLEMYGCVKAIRHRNQQVNEALCRLSRSLQQAGIRFLVVKGQVSGTLYPDSSLRQSGDIDFLCHPEDWDAAMTFVRKHMQPDADDSAIGKDLEFEADGIVYEMHKRLVDFRMPSHRRYWDNVVMTDLWNHPYTVNINGQDIPTLAPTYNILYTFAHLVGHLLYEGVGLRQFCDFACMLKRWHHLVDAQLLKQHLQGVGLLRAYTGMGAVLTDYLGMPADNLAPFTISRRAHQMVPMVLANVVKRGNFGLHVQYLRPRGVVHGIQLFYVYCQQGYLMAHYAPGEALWNIVVLVRGWARKIASNLNSQLGKLWMPSCRRRTPVTPHTGH